MFLQNLNKLTPTSSFGKMKAKHCSCRRRSPRHFATTTRGRPSCMDDIKQEVAPSVSSVRSHLGSKWHDWVFYHSLGNRLASETLDTRKPLHMVGTNNHPLDPVTCIWAHSDSVISEVPADALLPFSVSSQQGGNNTQNRNGKRGRVGGSHGHTVDVQRRRGANRRQRSHAG